SVVPRHTSRQPENIAGAQVRLEDSFEFMPAHSGIPHLHHGIEIALFGGDQRAAAIHVDAAAFEQTPFPGTGRRTIACRDVWPRSRAGGGPSASPGTSPMH